MSKGPVTPERGTAKLICAVFVKCHIYEYIIPSPQRSALSAQLAVGQWGIFVCQITPKLNSVQNFCLDLTQQVNPLIATIPLE